MMALIQMKRNEYLIGLDMVDSKDQFESVTSCKWWKIVDSMNASGHSLLQKNIIACKDKWGTIYRDFKYIFDYMASIKNNTRY